MKYFITVIICGFLSGCGDDGDDTGSDTAEVIDTSSEESE
jgi:hypothetical protein